MDGGDWGIFGILVFVIWRHKKKRKAWRFKSVWREFKRSVKQIVIFIFVDMFVDVNVLPWGIWKFSRPFQAVAKWFRKDIAGALCGL